MAIKKEVHIDQIEITAIGHISVRFAKQVVDTHAGHTDIISAQNHRVSFQIGANILAQMVQVNTHLSQMGFDAVPAAEITRIVAYANLTWTPALIAAWQAHQAEVDAANAIANTGGIVI
jgi:hypothetical protein